MTTPIRPDTTDFEKWKAERDFREWQKNRGTVQPQTPAEGTRQMPGTMPQDPRSGAETAWSLIANLADAGTLGSLDELAGLTGGIEGLFQRGATGVIPGARAGYQGMNLLRKGGIEHDPIGTSAARALGTAAVVVPSLAVGGPAPSLVKSAVQSGAFGGATGLLSEGDIPERLKTAALTTALGAGVPPLVAGGMWLAGKVPGVARGLKSLFGPMVGTEGEAANVVAQRMAIDQTSGLLKPMASDPSVPRLAIDEAGPAVQGLAKGILREPGEGRAILGSALERRSEAMRPAVTAALEKRIGLTGDAAKKVLTGIADEQAALAAAQEMTAAQQKIVNAAARQPVPQPGIQQLNAAYQAEVGNVPNGVQGLRTVMERTKAAMNTIYADARAATQGFAVDSPTFQEIIKTPIGKQAWEYAQIAKQNTNTPVPMVERALPVGGLSPEKVTELNTLAKARGLPPIPQQTESVPVPDPESLHLMKRYFADVSRLGQQDGANGLQAARASGALAQWDKIRGEITNTAWHEADAAATKLFDIQRAAKLAMDAGRATTNPGSRRALTASLDAIRERVAQMSPDERAVFDPLLRFSVSTRLQRTGMEAARTALTNPQSDLWKLVTMATGDEQAPARMAAAVAKVPKSVPPTLKVPEASPTLRAAERGLAALNTPAEAMGANAGRTLPVLARDVSKMSPEELAAFRTASAANLRQAWEGAPVSEKSPGRFFARSPERVEQVGHAFQSPGTAGLFQNTVKAWDDVQALKNRLMGGSDTAANLAEQGARASEFERAVADYSTMGTGYATRRVFGRLSQESQAAARRAVDEEVAKILAKEGGKLSEAQATARAREILARTRRRFGIGAGLLAADQFAYDRQR